MRTIKKETAKVGSEIEAYCTKCKLVLDHIVVAMIDNTPKKVECLTCHGHHAYRDSKPTRLAKTKVTELKYSEPKKQRKKSEVSRKKTKNTQEKTKKVWQEILDKKNLDIAKPYYMSGTYTVNDLINHSKFGMGIVTGVITTNKMVILFEDGYKYMV
ncbi:MAG: hypothetical protein V1872_12410, partial [bacterium]